MRDYTDRPGEDEDEDDDDSDGDDDDDDDDDKGDGDNNDDMLASRVNSLSFLYTVSPQKEM